MKKKKLHPVHPGEVLLEEFLKAMNLSQNKLALSLGVPPRRINEIVLEKRRVTAENGIEVVTVFWDFRGVLDWLTVTVRP